MTNIKTLVRRLLGGKLSQKELSELWQRRDVTQHMQREWDDCAKPAEEDALRENRIWERIVPRTELSGKPRPELRVAWRRWSYGFAASIMPAAGTGLTIANLLWPPRSGGHPHPLQRQSEHRTDRAARRFDTLGSEPTPRAATPRISGAENVAWNSAVRASSRWRKTPRGPSS